MSHPETPKTWVDNFIALSSHQPAGTPSSWITAVDVGLANLTIGLGEGKGRMPNFDDLQQGVSGHLCKPNAPVRIHAANLIDLLGDVPRTVDSPVRIYSYTSPEFATLLAAAGKNDVITRVTALHTAMLNEQSLAATRFYDFLFTGDGTVRTTLEMARPYRYEVTSTHHIMSQLINALLSPAMLWLWLFPCRIIIENQVDHLAQFHDKPSGSFKYENPHGPLVWLVSHLIPTILSTVDMLLFGAPRDCRIAAKKYGADSAALLDFTKQAHPRLKDDYGLRKQKSVHGALIALYALGEYDLIVWIVITLKEHGRKLDDVCDSVSMILGFFNEEVRTVQYSEAQTEEITNALTDLIERTQQSISAPRNGVQHIAHRNGTYDQQDYNRIRKMVFGEKVVKGHVPNGPFMQRIQASVTAGKSKARFTATSPVKRKRDEMTPSPPTRNDDVPAAIRPKKEEQRLREVVADDAEDYLAQIAASGILPGRVIDLTRMNISRAPALVGGEDPASTLDQYREDDLLQVINKSVYSSKVNMIPVATLNKAYRKKLTKRSKHKVPKGDSCMEDGEDSREEHSDSELTEEQAMPRGYTNTYRQWNRDLEKTFGKNYDKASSKHRPASPRPYSSDNFIDD